MTTSVAIYIYPDVEVLDFAGPYEVFTAANRVHMRQNPEGPDVFRVFTVARNMDLVRARAGVQVQPDFTMVSHPPVDLLVVPGGVVTRELQQTDLLRWIAEHAGRGGLTASVCTGAFLLAKAGLLSGKSATTHWEDIADLRAMFGDVIVREGPRWIDEGSVVTSAGISAGIDMSLHLVERLVSRSLAVSAARQMDIVWRDAV